MVDRFGAGRLALFAAGPTLGTELFDQSDIELRQPRPVLAFGNLEEEVEAIVREPSAYTEDDLRGEFARALGRADRPLRQAPAAWRQWGEGLEQESINQMARACQLPVAVAGALIPDAHVGYGLPIGGVLATENAVIPYAVGVDIACRMKLSVLDQPVASLAGQFNRYKEALLGGTRFGVGVEHRPAQSHPVMDRDWNVTRITRERKDTAWRQLGTSGSGNHFVEFGVLSLLILWGLRRGPRLPRPISPDFHAHLAFSAATLYAITDELHQALVPFRRADALDLLETHTRKEPDDLEAQAYLEIARAALLRFFRARAGSGDRVPFVRIAPNEVLKYNLPAPAGFLLSMIDGRISIDELLSVSGMDPFDALRALHNLLDAGIVEARAPAAEARP